MSLKFNHLLKAIGVEPNQVRLLRHQTGPFQGRTPYTLWRDHPEEFLRYQSLQGQNSRSKLSTPVWASFVVTPDQKTLFVGAFSIEYAGPCPPETIDPLRNQLASERDRPHADLYLQEMIPESAEWSGRVVIDWGKGARSWIQRADKQNKPILEISAAFREEKFPGYGIFYVNLSMIASIPTGWIEALRSVRGVYILTCPRTREQYIGSATGNDGFIGRWLHYLQNGHGGNVGLKSRDPSDYQVSILEVAGSMATTEEILVTEQRWKAKLQSREMGLNRN
jgi:hypothetical protein